LTSLSNVHKYLKECQQDSVINVRKLAKKLRITIEITNVIEATSMGYMVSISERKTSIQPYLFLNEKNSFAESNTVIAMLLAEMLISPEKIHQDGYSMNIFEFKDIRRMRDAQVMLLATRLALTEQTIEDVCELSGLSQHSNCYDCYTQEFVNSAKKGHHVAYLVAHNGFHVA
jgi:hypothetical protein